MCRHCFVHIRMHRTVYEPSYRDEPASLFIPGWFNLDNNLHLTDFHCILTPNFYAEINSAGLHVM